MNDKVLTMKEITPNARTKWGIRREAVGTLSLPSGSVHKCSLSVPLQKLSLSVLLLLLLVSCATVQFRPPMEIDSFEVVGMERYDQPVSKALYDVRSQTLYVMHRDWHEIRFYRDGRMINRIGGLGLERSNFQKLGDMALDGDGALLVLDTGARQVRKFNSDGMYISQIDMRGTIQPELLALGADQTIYIYDGLGSQIVAFSVLDGREQFRFGKFELNRISQLTCSRDYVLAYSAADHKTTVFTVLGQSVRTMDWLGVYDGFNNLIEYHNGILTGSSSAAPVALPTGNARNLNCVGNVILFTVDHEVRRILINYRSPMQ